MNNDFYLKTVGDGTKNIVMIKVEDEDIYCESPCLDKC